MPFKAEVIADSISPAGHRLTSMVVTYPRIILAEMNTHRVFSRNTASSRAIPVEKMIAAVDKEPFIPESWPKNQPGMQACSYLGEAEGENAEEAWRCARHDAVLQAKNMVYLGVHKQIVNRLLEPFSWTTQIISATEWENFFKLRCHPDAQPEMQKIARMMREVYEKSVPVAARERWYHLPFIETDEVKRLLTGKEREIQDNLQHVKKVSVARCARVSYLTHDGKHNVEADFKLYERLKSSGHWSPFEHVATPCDCTPLQYMEYGDQAPIYCQKPSNFKGWHQLRYDEENSIA